MQDEIIVPDEIQQVDDKISELSKHGYMKLKENQPEEARFSFESILEIDPNNNYALVGLGDTERKLGNIDKAITYYNKCLSFYPDNNYALFGLADCYKAQNQYTKAIKIWEAYLVQDEKNITVMTRVADAFRKIKDYRKSKELYLKVLDMEQDNPYALIGLGHLSYDFKEYKDALYYWTRIYDINKESVDIRVLTSIGNCHRKLKTFEEGTVFFEKALEREPNNFYALFGLADCYRGMNQQFKSIEYWNRILELDPQNKVILTRTGDAYRTTGNYDLARQYYQKALDIDFDVYAAIGLALLFKGEGNFDEAIKRFQNLIKDEPRNGRLYVDLAECYLAINKKAEAKKLLESFMQIDTRNANVRALLEKLS